MKKKLILIGIIVSTIILAVLSVVTALKIKQLGTQPIAPSVPQSQPEATDTIPEILPSTEACKQTFLVALAPSPTPTPICKIRPSCLDTPPYCEIPEPVEGWCPTPTATNTPGGPSPTPTATGTPGPSPTPTSTLTPGPTATSTPGPSPTPTSTLTPGPTVTGTPGPTNTPGPSPTPTSTLTLGPTITGTPAPTSTPRPGVTTAVVATPTEIQLPAAGLKLPTLVGIIAGFLFIALGAALVF